MNKSIDDESPEAWSRINKWHRNGPDQHPLFPTKDENMPEAKMASSYTRQGYKFKTSWGDDDVNSPAHYSAQGDIECIDAKARESDEYKKRNDKLKVKMQ